jgi:hypothetical protein
VFPAPTIHRRTVRWKRETLGMSVRPRAFSTSGTFAPNRLFTSLSGSARS